MVRQHNSQSQRSTGNQGIAQCTLITDDRINTGEHDGSSRDKEYSADNRAGDTGKNVCQLGAKAISQEDKSGNLSYAARAYTGSGDDADVLGVTGAGQTAEEGGDHAAKTLGKDTAVDVLNAIDFITGSAGSGVVTNRFEHGSNIAGETANNGSADKSDGRSALTLQIGEGEQLGQCEPRRIMNSSPVEHAKCGSSNYTNDNNSDENKALRKQSLTTAELQDQCKKECDKRQDKALGILCGECPLYSNSGSYITDSCYYGTNYNRGEELADLTHNSGTAQQSLQCTADDDGAPNGRQTIGGSYAAHGGSERS